MKMADPDCSAESPPKYETHAESDPSKFTVPVPAEWRKTLAIADNSSETRLLKKHPRFTDSRPLLVREIQKNWGTLWVQNNIPEKRRPRVTYGTRTENCRIGKPPENDATKWPLFILRALRDLLARYKDRVAVYQAIEDAVAWKNREKNKSARYVQTEDIKRVMMAFEVGITVDQVVKLEKHVAPTTGKLKVAKPQAKKTSLKPKIKAKPTTKVTEAIQSPTIEKGVTVASPDADDPPPYSPRPPSPSIGDDSDSEDDLKALRLRLK